MKSRQLTKLFQKISEERLVRRDNSVSLTVKKYSEIIKKVKLAKVKTSKEPPEYKLLKRYDVLEVDGIQKLIAPIKPDGKVVYFVHDEEIFEILNKVHTTMCHGGQDRMVSELKQKYKNITYKDVTLFLSLCEPCLQKQKRDRKGTAVKPLTKETLVKFMLDNLNYRCQLDLIDCQSRPDGEFKFVMVYQQYPTKFTILKPLRFGTTEEIANNLIDVFTLIGAPVLLQLENGEEFVSKIINNLKSKWPDLKILRGRPQIQEMDIKNVINAWMEENESTHWRKGLRFVQLTKNTTFDSAIKKSPFEALFGCPLRLGLAASNIPPEALAKLQEEEDLEKIISSIRMRENGDYEFESCEELEKNVGEVSPVVKEELFLCVVCQNECADDKQCSFCGHYTHDICGTSTDTAPTKYFCLICDRKHKIQKRQSVEELTVPVKKIKQEMELVK